MANFGLKVGTDEMAHKMDEVSSGVNLATGAVVVMKEAVLKTESEATDMLCGKVSGGFYSLVTSQIAQKCAHEQSALTAAAMELVQQSKELNALKDRMTRDYDRISSRYSRTFNALNAELKVRISALDKAAVNLVNTDSAKLLNRQSDNIAVFPINQVESLELSQKIKVAKLKHRTEKLICILYEYIHLEKKMTALIEKSLVVPNCDFSKSMDHFCPMLVFKSNNAPVKSYYSQPLKNNDIIFKDILSAKLENRFKDNNWNPVADEEKLKIMEDFERLITSSNVSDRVADNMRKLMKNCNWDTLKK